MSKRSQPKTLNLKNIIIGFISIVIIAYSLVLIVNTINNGIKRYNLIENEQAKLNKLKQENETLKTQLSQNGNIDEKLIQALNNFNLIDPQARVYVVKLPEEVKYLDVKSEIQNYKPKFDDRSTLQKFFDDLLGK